jgi:hypothetical protein
MTGDKARMPGAKPKAAVFALTNAQVKPEAGATMPNQTSPPGSAGSGQRAMGARDRANFQLEAGPKVDLGQHLNQQVEVRGTLEKADQMSPGTGSSTGTRTRNESAWPRLRVSTVNWVSSTCP